MAGVMVLGFLALIRSAQAREVSGRNLRAMRAEYRAVDGWPVELTILQGATPTGYDHGVVWSEGGRLFFVGARTSFGLFGTSVSSATRHELASAKREMTSLTLSLRSATVAGPVSLVLRPLLLGGNGTQSTAELGWAVRSWLAQDTVGEGQLPPLTLGPEAPTPEGLLAQAVGTTLLWATVTPLLAAALIAALEAWAWWALVPLAILAWPLCLAYGEFGHPVERWQAWRDRRRLDAALRQNKER